MPLKNKHVLILSGPTREYIDPVRFIGNASSGKMGKALAQKALSLGASVTFISGPVPNENLPISPAIKIIPVTSSEEMLKQSSTYFKKADITIFAAAISDYTPEKHEKNKIKSGNNEISLKLSPTKDVSKQLCANKKANQICIGFALETKNGKNNSLKKLKNKNLDGIILNTPQSLNAISGEFTFIDPKKTHKWGLISKTDCAKNIFDELLKKFKI